MFGNRVLSVGQCAADHGSITRLLKQVAAEAVPADSAEEALSRLRQESFPLVLVNRVFDATGEGGLDFIRRVKGDPELQDVPMMLVSNFPEAQEEAAAAGAIPGFGKDGLREPATLDLLRAHLR
jgi:two-component system chemotaxis response regulator CheY